MEDITLDFSAACDGGMSFDADLSFQCDLGGGSDTSFLNGVDLGQGQMPGVDRLLRQLVRSRAPGTNLGGAVLARPGVPAQTTRPVAGHILQYSTTSVNPLQPAYQGQPGYYAQPITLQPPAYNGTATVISTQNVVPLQTVQPILNAGLTAHTVQPTTTVINMGIPGHQRPTTRPVVVAPPTPSNWMTLSIISVIFFTLPFGLIAFFFSYQVNESLKRGDHETAVKNANIAKWMNILAMISGASLFCVVVLVVVL